MPVHLPVSFALPAQVGSFAPVIVHGIEHSCCPFGRLPCDEHARPVLHSLPVGQGSPTSAVAPPLLPEDEELLLDELDVPPSPDVPDVPDDDELEEDAPVVPDVPLVDDEELVVPPLVLPVLSSSPLHAAWKPARAISAPQAIAKPLFVVFIRNLFGSEANERVVSSSYTDVTSAMCRS